MNSEKITHSNSRCYLDCLAFLEWSSSRVRRWPWPPRREWESFRRLFRRPPFCFDACSRNGHMGWPTLGWPQLERRQLEPQLERRQLEPQLERRQLGWQLASSSP